MTMMMIVGPVGEGEVLCPSEVLSSYSNFFKLSSKLCLLNTIT